MRQRYCISSNAVLRQFSFSAGIKYAARWLYCEKCSLCKHHSCPSFLSWWIHLWLLHCHLPVGTSRIQHNPFISCAQVPTMRVLLSYHQPSTFLYVVHHLSSHAFSSSLKLLNLSQHFPAVWRAKPAPWWRQTLSMRSKLPHVVFHCWCSMLHFHSTTVVLTSNTNTTDKILTCHMCFRDH